jgi:mannose-1-phosphate guanylyltransferase/mannose-6-phosphate isomerase
MIPVILSGGSGTRLWPISRTKLPKQFCQIFEESLQVATLKRLVKIGTPWTVTSSTLKDLTLQTLKSLQLPTENVVFEPQGKNTAPAIALLCSLLQKKGMGHEVVGVFPADHLIEKEEAFLKANKIAETEAQNGKIVILGIQPTYPATGFGYIQTQTSDAKLLSHPVLSFREKPTHETAVQFLKEGNFHWNAGIFIFKVDVMAAIFNQYQPEMWKLAQQIQIDLGNLTSIYSQFQNISIDYAIMEKLSSAQLSCIPCDLGWSDVGTWDSVAEVLEKDPQTKNNPQLVQVEGQNNFIHSLPEKTYACVGVDNLLVVDTADALLITQKGCSQKVKDVVDLLKEKKSKVIDEHVYEFRPWGKYEILKNTDTFKSKVIHVSPGQQISYQSHSKREEHWIITKGYGEVILDDKTIPIKPGSYINIPLGAKHRIRNTQDQVIEFVEVQLGTYFGEDDIVRYQDDYQRS